MKNSFYKILFAALFLSLTACSHYGTPYGTSNNNKAPLATSDYTVNFEDSGDFSSGLALNKTLSEKKSTLAVENFAVVIVDLAGNVLEKLTLNEGDIKKNTDGTWIVTLPGKQRTDRLIVVDLIKPNTLTIASSIHQDGLVFTPTSDTRVNLTAGTTVAYKHFIEALGGVGYFADAGAEAVNTVRADSIGSFAANK
jgi:hypothetical protein